MQKILLTQTQVQTLVSQNKYKVHEASRFISRCIDGRYPNSPDLPALAFPGGDAGEIALIYATGKTYGFSVDLKKTAAVVEKMVGGVKKLNFHTDSHADTSKVAAGCGHIKQLTTDTEAYHTDAEFVSFLLQYLSSAKKKGAQEIELHGDHQEGAILLLQGEYGVQPQLQMETDEGRKTVQVFVFHKMLVDERHKALAKLLIEKKAVDLPPECDEEYLYSILSEMTENHLFETVKRLAKGLPIYSIRFDSEGGFEVREMGWVGK